MISSPAALCNSASPILISYWLAGFQHTLDPFQRFLFATKAQKGFTFQVEQILFAYYTLFTKVTSAHNISQFFCHYRIVICSISRTPHSVDPRQQCTKCRTSKHFDIFSLNRGLVTTFSNFDHRSFSFRNAPRLIDHYLINSFSQQSQFECFCCRSGHLSSSYSEKPVFQGYGFRFIFMHFICRPHYKFFCTTSSGNKSHTQFNKPDICFCRCTKFVGMQAQLACTAQCKRMWCYYNRNGRITRAHHCLLKHSHRHVEFIKFLFHSKHEYHSHVGPCTEVLSLVRNHEAPVFFFSDRYRLLNTFKHFATNSIHFCVPLQARYIIAKMI